MLQTNNGCFWCIILFDEADNDKLHDRLAELRLQERQRLTLYAQHKTIHDLRHRILQPDSGRIVLLRQALSERVCDLGAGTEQSLK